MSDKLRRIETYCRRVSPASVVARQILERFFDGDMSCQAYRCDDKAHMKVHYGKHTFDVCRSHYDDVFAAKAITLWDGEHWMGYAAGVVTI